jgi:hypothetical protein
MSRALSLTVCLLMPAAAWAQQTAPATPPPQPAYAADSAAIVQVVTRLFDGMRTRDTAMMRTLFHEPTPMRSAYVSRGANTITADGPEDWFTGIVSAPDTLLLDERLGPPEIRVDGNLASMWVYYEFYAGDNFSHCGVDSIQFGRTDEGWKIILLSDSKRRTECAKSLPKS